MYSFRDINGNDIPFESKRDLELELQKDIETDEITAYLVLYNEHVYEVTQKTYEVIENM